MKFTGSDSFSWKQLTPPLVTTLTGAVVSLLIFYGLNQQMGESWLPGGVLVTGILGTALLSTWMVRLMESNHEDQLHSVLTSAVDAIISANDRGEIILWNDGAEEMFGYKRAEAVGKDVTIIMPERYREDHKRGFERFLETGEGKIMGEVVELEGKRKNGEVFPIELSLSTWDQGERPHFTAVIRDISDRKNRERELERQQTLTRNMIDSLPDVFYLFDREGNMLEWNEELHDVSGYSAEEIKEMEPLDFIPSEDTDRISRAIQRVFDQKMRQREESYLVTKSGDKIPYEYTGTPLFDEDDELVGLVGTGRDISKRKAFEEELRDRERRYRNLVEEVEDYAIFRLDAEGKISSWNAGAEKIKGYTSDEIIGQHVSTFYPEEYRNRDLPEKLLKQAREEGRVEHEGWRVRKDGSRFWASVVITAIFREGELQGYSKVTRDLTERKEKEEELERLNEELEEKVKQRTEELEQFVYAASHDLSEPARVMHTYAGFIEEDLDDVSDTVQEDINFIKDSASRMKELIDSLLKLSRTSRADMNIETVDVNECVDNALQQLGESIKTTDVTIDRDDLPEIQADPTLLTSLYQNLISNALKYGGNGQVQITLTAEKDDGEWVLGVKDEGEGIDPEHQDQIFEPFKHLHDRKNYTGTGIGLSICKRIVQQHNGEIWVESEPGHGAHFKFILRPREVKDL